MSAPAYMIRQTPGGAARDTFTTFRMRQAMRIVPRKPAAEHWAALPLATRQALCTAAVGMRGLDLYAMAWDSIGAHDRLRIQGQAHRVAEGLV